MQRPLLSLIVPIYGCPDLLGKCLSSLEKQICSFPYEIILSINKDGDPKAIEMAYDFANKSKVAHPFMLSETNVAKGDCRLFGVSHAKGEFISFMDSDDFYDSEHAIEGMIQETLAHKSDITVFSFYGVKKNRKSIYFGQKRKKKLLNRKQALQRLNNDNTVPYFLWNKVFRNELFEGPFIHFGEKKDLFEDCALTYSLFLKADSVYLSDQAYYCYVLDNPISATSEPRTDRGPYRLSLYACQRFFLNRCPQYIKLWKRALFRHVTMIFFDNWMDRKNGKSSYFHLLRLLHLLRKKNPPLEGMEYEAIVRRSIE